MPYETDTLPGIFEQPNRERHMKIHVTLRLDHPNGQEAGSLTAHSELFPEGKQTVANVASVLISHLTTAEEFPRLFQRALSTVPMVGGTGDQAEQIQARLDRQLSQREKDLHFKVIEAVRDFGMAVNEHIELYQPLKAEINALIQSAYAYTIHKTGREAGLDQILGLIEYIDSFQAPDRSMEVMGHLQTLYRLFESANRSMERRGFQGYRLTPPYAAVRQFLSRESRLPAPPMEDSEEDRLAWNEEWKAPEGKTKIRAGDQITLNPLGAALLSMGKTRGLIMADISEEREKQIANGYGSIHDAQHDHNTWIAIAAHELGHAPFVPDVQYRQALVKTAAVAVAALEAYDEEHS